MYLKFYGLTEKPFSQTPDPRFLYWNDSYREALASLRYGIQERKGFLTMIGEAGTGKTTLLRKLLDDLGPDVVSVFLFNPNASFEEILEYTLSELGIMVPSGRKLAMLQRLNEFLLAAFAEGKNTILLIDEAQDLDTEVLESLRLLSNLETAKEKILQIVLSGQPELATRLAQENLRQLKQRIAVRCRLEPLQRGELAEYIRARLRVAGGDESLFDESSLDPIWAFANGIPRLVNTVCDNALLVGYAVGKARIDRAAVEEVVQDLQRLDDRPLSAAPISPAAAPPSSPPPPPPAAASVTAAPAPPPPDGIPGARGDGPPTASAPTSAPGWSDAPITPAVPPFAAAPAAGRVAPAGPASPAPAKRSGVGRIAAVVVGAVILLAGGIWVGAHLRPPAEPTRLAERPPAPLVPPDRPRAAPAEPEVPPRAPAAVAPLGESGAGPRDAAPAAAAAAGSAMGIAPAPAGGPAVASVPAGDGSDAGNPPPEGAHGPSPAAVGAVPAPAGAPAVGGPGVATRPALAPAPAAPSPGTAQVETPRAPIGDASHGGAARQAEPTRPDPRGGPAPVGGTAAVAIRPEVEPAREPVRTARVEDRADPRPAAATASRDAAQDIAPQDVQDSLVAENPEGKEIRVRPGDTLYQLAWRTYGSANYTTLDMLRAANPGIHDVNRIVAGRVLVFPEPGPGARIVSDNGELAVLALTTPEAGQAAGVQRKLQEKFGEKVDIEPVVLGEGQRLYRVFLRELQGESQARSIAESLGTILDDPDERPGS